MTAAESDRPTPPAGRPAAWQARFIERVASLADVNGLPYSYAQVFAWLVVCEPAHQSVDQMQQALGLSSGAISMATTSLIRMGVVERTSQPGQRRHYYRFRPGGWEKLLRSRVEATAQIRAVAEEALADAPDRPVRLAEMRNIYAWFETAMKHFLEEQPWARPS